MLNILQKITKRLCKIYYMMSSDRYISYLRKGGIKIGIGTVVFDPKDIRIDMTRPDLIEIGNHVFLHRGTNILTHDWASWCFVESYDDFIPSHGHVKIGNNVWLGENVTILKGVTIGDNVIIGIGSIVTHDIPSNSIAVGSPCKVIGSYSDYYKKRKNEYISECVEYAKAIMMHGKMLKKEDFYDDYPCFVDNSNFMNYNYPYCHVFKKKQFEEWKKNHHAKFQGFDDFIKFINK